MHLLCFHQRKDEEEDAESREMQFSDSKHEMKMDWMRSCFDGTSQFFS